MQTFPEQRYMKRPWEAGTFDLALTALEESQQCWAIFNVQRAQQKIYDYKYVVWER